jgi:exonuclease SbcC
LRRILGGEVGIEEVISRYIKVKEEIKSLGFDAEEINIKTIEDYYKKLRVEVDEIREKLGKIRGRLESNTKLLDELTKEEKELEDMIASIAKDIQIYPVLDILVNTLLGKDGVLAKVLTLEARRLMEKYTNIVLKELGMDFKVKISEDFDIEVHSNLGVLDIKSLSGGETVSLAIALRIALAYTVFGRLPGFFILDEPTQFLDIERRRAVFEIIKKLSEKVPQVIVVTHDPEVEELSDKIYLISKEGGRSVVREKEKFIEAIVGE